jgi:hypothetical protein
MKKEDAEKLSILIMQINSQIDQSIAFVQDRGSESEFKQHRFMAAQAMGRLIDILTSLYEDHPFLKPVSVGGTYEVDPQIFSNWFYQR